MIDNPPPWDMSTLGEISRLKPHMSAADIANQMVAEATEAELRALAIAHVARWIDVIRRDDARDIEKAAERPIEQPFRPPSTNDRFEKWLADPSKHWHLPNARVRAAFKQWAGERFDAWHAAARLGAETAQQHNKYAVEIFEGDWHPGGVMAYERELRAERVRNAIADAVEQAAEEIRLEVTQELLGSVFALGDGVRVSWGEATVAQHRQRISLLVGNAAGSVETAARHKAAIHMIEQAGVSRLGDLAVAA